MRCARWAISTGGVFFSSRLQVYQRCIAVPLSQAETMWREYESFENGLNEHLARALLDEHLPVFQTARGVCRDRVQVRTRGP